MTDRRPLLQLAVLLLLAYAVGGCSTPSPAPPTTGASSATPSPQPTPVPLSDVEIIWQAPPADVDAFIIYYGYDESTLDKEARVSQASLDSINDPDYGKVYRYLLKGVVPDRTIYVAIASVRGKEISQRSAVMAIEAASNGN